MSDNIIDTVSITIGTTMYGRFEDLPNTTSHILAEFIDNALQSYRDNKTKLENLEEDYKLKVTIDIDWDKADNRAKTIVITDNAAGIAKDKYVSAFMPALTPENNKGLNEFGMGLKTAACWLGESWTVKTKALNEDVERTVSFNLNEVIANDLEELPVETSSKGINEHYTIITTTDSTKNVPAYKSISKIKTELASIYRKSLREKEMIIKVCGEELAFEEYEILTAPLNRTPNSPPIYWKKEIDFKFGKYRAKGFIGILRDINSTQNGFVLLRRGRVIVGAETDGRYFPKCLSGSTGTFRYKRLFGELELDGFDVSFNKNDIQDKENLDALMEALKGEIHTKEFDLYNQAEEYRLDDTRKHVKKIVTKYNSSPKDNRSIISIDNFANNEVVQSNTESTKSEVANEPTGTDLMPVVIGEYGATYKIKDKNYTLKVQFVESGNDLFWVDVRQKNENIIICQINTKHIFFQYFGKPSESNIAILKTLAIAKFTARESGQDSATDLFNFFNEYIKKTKV
ncbi:MAG: hypothetical protein CVU12_00035 [Bacteroidetes bacterium HGW-Bacteroidetes-7]|jgi:hypothetical protein|nr:MAG: hypothetical protein CVU12_00035 [Bacteroidetes bacterium HGW-Bacteroidetes-7]